MELTQKDVERLKKLKRYIEGGTACTFNKNDSITTLNSILEPKCAVCRKPIESDLVIVNDRKFHLECSRRYKGV